MLRNAFENIKCPHCGKSYFSVSEPINCVEFAVLNIHPDPIYKNGILQNPEIYDPKPQTYHCTCQECGQKFWLTVEQKGVHTFNTIETDEQRDERLKNEWNNLLNKYKKEKEVQEEAEKVAELTGAKLGDTEVKDITGITNLEAGQGILTYKSDESTFVLSSADDCISHKLDYSEIEKLDKRIEEINKRLDKMEAKLNDK